MRRNQTALHVEKYKGLMDHVNTASASQAVLPGKVVIVPSSYSGSPCAMQQNYQDAMAIVCKYGKPDIFLTFTCNTKLPETVALHQSRMLCSLLDQGEVEKLWYTIHLYLLLEPNINELLHVHGHELLPHS